MTKVEMLAHALANELELEIKTGTKLRTETVLVLNELRKAQVEAEVTLGSDLDKMYQEFLAKLPEHKCPVIDLATKRKLL
jgi:hypothetical protein